MKALSVVVLVGVLACTPVPRAPEPKLVPPYPGTPGKWAAPNDYGTPTPNVPQARGVVVLPLGFMTGSGEDVRLVATSGSRRRIVVALTGRKAAASGHGADADDEREGGKARRGEMLEAGISPWSAMRRGGVASFFESLSGDERSAVFPRL